MKSGLKFLIYFFVFGNSCRFCFAQKAFSSNKESIIGVYQMGREVIHLMPNNLFYLKRAPRLNDVVIPECTDTIAKGKWGLFRKDFLLLKNSLDYNQIFFDIKQVRNFSDDSVYIKIELPNDDAFFAGRFEFDFYFFTGIGGSYQSTSNYIVLPKNKVTRDTICDFSLTIKDGYPYCDAGKKCYQRIYFRVFESYEKKYLSIALLLRYPILLNVLLNAWM